jgi:phenylpyruvate tautomerase PptA (4-oxalocrotonate tautomerase family)
MPLVKVEMRAGKSAEYKKAVLDTVHRALVDCFNIPEDDRNQRLYELDAAHYEISLAKTEDAIIVELTVFKGRSLDAKRQLYKAIVENLEKAVGLRHTDVLIVLNEQPLDNWGVRGGLPASEADLGYDINV